jgi:hypothetical protein
LTWMRAANSSSKHLANRQPIHSARPFFERIRMNERT